jgi:hypothetical protein
MTRTLVMCFLLAAACSRKAEPESQPIPWASTASPAATTPTSSASAGAAAVPAPLPPPAPAPSERILWNAPPNWQRLHSNSQVRKAWYRIPPLGSDAGEAEMMIFYFGEHEGGGSEANIQRWVGQFADAKPSDVKRGQRTANGMKQTTVEVQGTYAPAPMAGPAGPPKPNYALLAAVVDTPAGSWFFKLTGPRKTVEASRGDFYLLLDSVRPNSS